MKLNLGELRRIINEEALDLGKVVFSPKRKDNVPKDEPNTSVEEDLWSAINQYTLHGHALPPNIIGMLRGLIDQPPYDDFFTSPGVEGVDVVYRGMAVDGKRLARWVGIPEEKLGEYGERDNLSRTFSLPQIGVKGYVKPMSFSKDPDVAHAFSIPTMFSSDDQTTYSIIMTAKISDNPDVFLDLHAMSFKSSGMAIAYGNAKARPEQEVLALGPVKVDMIEWTLVTNEDMEELNTGLG